MLKRDTRLAAAAAATVALTLASVASAQTPVIDGTLDASYGIPYSVQTAQTGFGDNQSELDAGYFKIDNGKLYLMYTGNLESNNNKLVLFFDTRAGGQNVMRADNPDVNFNNLNSKYAGMTFDSGFEPDYFVSMSRDRDGITGEGNVYVDFSELNTTGGGLGGYAGSVHLGSLQVGAGTTTGGNNPGLPVIDIGYSDANTAGIGGAQGTAADQTAAQAVTTGMEIGIDLAALGITGNFKLMVGINGSNHDYWSNQFLAPMSATQTNLGSDGLGNFVPPGSVGSVNFATFAGDQFVTLNYTAPNSQWNNAGDGNWNTAANWQGGVPNAADARAMLGSLAGTAARTVTLDTNVQLANLTFDSAGTYTIAGSGTNVLTVAGNPAAPAIQVLSGSHVINAPLALGATTNFTIAASSALNVAGDMNAVGRAIVKAGPGALSFKNVRAASLNVTEGSVKINSNGGADGVSTVNALTIAGGATPTASLDVTNNAVVVNYGDLDPTVLPAIKDLIVAGRNGGNWAGLGITSSTAAANASSRALGYAEASDVAPSGTFLGQTVDATAVIVRYTRLGDADMNGTVALSDFTRLASGFGNPGTWSKGDFNYDGQVSLPDFTILAANFGLSAADLARGSAVPEPATLGLVGVAAMGLIRRRRA